MDDPLAFEPPWLRIGHLLFADQLKPLDAVRLKTPILEAGTTTTTTTDEDPYMTCLIKRNAGIIVRVINTVFVVNNRWLRDKVVVVVVVGCHRQQVSLTFFSATVNEKGLFDSWCINRHWNMLGGVSAESSRILITLFEELTQREPDTLDNR
jgi:hypothetical protein